MTAMKAICDTWNMIEKYGIEGWKQIDSVTVIVPDCEYDRLYNSVQNKRYIRNLLADSVYNRKQGFRVAI